VGKGKFNWLSKRSKSESERSRALDCDCVLAAGNAGFYQVFTGKKKKLLDAGTAYQPVSFGIDTTFPWLNLIA
jgi:hypothetical protein